jgi:hypothetical protein
VEVLVVSVVEVLAAAAPVGAGSLDQKELKQSRNRTKEIADKFIAIEKEISAEKGEYD